MVPTTLIHKIDSYRPFDLNAMDDPIFIQELKNKKWLKFKTYIFKANEAWVKFFYTNAHVKKNETLTLIFYMRGKYVVLFKDTINALLEIEAPSLCWLARMREKYATNID